MANKGENMDNDNGDNSITFADISAVFTAVASSPVVLVDKLHKLIKIRSNNRLVDQFTQDIQSKLLEVCNFEDRWNSIIKSNALNVSYFQDCCKDVIQYVLNVSYLRDQDRCNDVVGKAQDVCPKTTSIIKSESLSSQNVKDILDEIQQAKEQMASNTVTFGALVSAAIILVQVWRLCKVWFAVEDAKNVVHESGSKINEINANIEKLSTWATELRGFTKKYEDGILTCSIEKKENLIDNIRQMISRMRSTYADTQRMICKLEIAVNGKTQILGVYQQEQISNGIMHTIHCVTNFIQCFQFSGLLSTGYVVLQWLITGIFFGLAAGNARMYYITGKTLDRLREVLRQIDQLDEQLSDIIHEVDEADKWAATQPTLRS